MAEPKEPDIELEEWPEFARVKPTYRARMLQSSRAGAEEVVLDVREYLDGSNRTGWVGFTRKGLRVNRAQAVVLREIIEAALKAGL